MLASVQIGRSPMPKFVIERDVPGAGNLTEAELREIPHESVKVLKKWVPRSSGSKLHNGRQGVLRLSRSRRGDHSRTRQAHRPSRQSSLRRAPTYRSDNRGLSASANPREQDPRAPIPLQSLSRSVKPNLLTKPSRIPRWSMPALPDPDSHPVWLAPPA